jgi:hypothetical protein
MAAAASTGPSDCAAFQRLAADRNFPFGSVVCDDLRPPFSVGATAGATQAGPRTAGLEPRLAQPSVLFSDKYTVCNDRARRAAASVAREPAVCLLPLRQGECRPRQQSLAAGGRRGVSLLRRLQRARDRRARPAPPREGATVTTTVAVEMERMSARAERQGLDRTRVSRCSRPARRAAPEA